MNLGVQNIDDLDIVDYSKNSVISDQIVFEYLSKFLAHMHHVDVYRYYIALEAPQLISEVLPKKKLQIFDTNISEYELLYNYTRFFRDFIGKICKNNMKFSYCNMLMNSLSSFITEDYVFKQKIKENNYQEILDAMYRQIIESIKKVLLYISKNEYEFSNLFLWRSKRKILEKGKISYLSYKHPLYRTFSSIDPNSFISNTNQIDYAATKILNGDSIVFYGYIIIPEDFGIDTGMNEIISNKYNILVKFVNRCFQELIDNGFYDLFWLDESLRSNNEEYKNDYETIEQI